MGNLLMAVASLCLYAQSKYFPKNSPTVLTMYGKSKLFVAAIAAVAIVLECLEFGVLTGIAISILQFVLYTSCYILCAPYSRYSSLIILALAALISITTIIL